MSWDNTSIEKLQNAVETFDRPGVDRICAGLVVHLRNNESPPSKEEASRVLKLLRRKRYLQHLQHMADAFVHNGVDRGPLSASGMHRRSWTRKCSPQGSLLAGPRTRCGGWAAASTRLAPTPSSSTRRFVSLKSAPPGVAPCPTARVLPPLKSEPPPRAFIVGHPSGRMLPMFSIQDDLMLDYDDTWVHYRAPTEPGSSGSPVSTENGS